MSLADPPQQSAALAIDQAAERHSAAAELGREPMWPRQGLLRHVVVSLGLVVLAILANANTLSTRYVILDRSGFTLDSRYIIELDPRSRAQQMLDRGDMQKQLFLRAAKAVQAQALYGGGEDPGPLAAQAKELADAAKYSDLGFINYFTKDYWWPKGISGLYRPLTSITYWWNFAPIREIEPAKWEKMKMEDAEGYHNVSASALIRFHWTNTLLHALAAVLVYYVMLAVTWRFWVSVFAAAMFCTHPITVESVANIIGRADIFAAIAVFSTLLLYIRSTKVESYRRVPWLALATVVATFGVFFKESAIAAGPICVFYELIFKYHPRIEGLFTRGWTKWWDDGTRLLGDFLAACLSFASRGWVWFVIPVAAFFIARSLIFSEKPVTFQLPVKVAGLTELTFGPSTPPEEPFLDNPIRGNPYTGLNPSPFWNLVETRVTAMKVVVLLLGKLVAPINLSADYSFNEIRIFTSSGASIADALAIGCALGAAALGAWGWVIQRRGGRPGGRWVVACVLGSYVVLRLLWLATPFGTAGPLLDVGALLAAGLFMGFLVWGVVMWARGNKAGAFMIFYFFWAMMPTANLAKIIGSIMAERFMYLPLMGFVGGLSMLVFWAADRLISLQRRPGAAQPSSPAARPPGKLEDSPQLPPLPWLRFVPHVALSVLVVLYTARTLHRNNAWRSDELLWEAALPVSQNAFRCYQSYAFAIYENAQIDRVRNRIDVDEYRRRVQKMIDVDEAALPIVDALPNEMNSARLYLHLGMYYAAMGQLLTPPTATELPPEARAWYLKSVDILKRAVPVDRAFNELNRRKEISRLRTTDKTTRDVPDAGLAPVYLILGESQLRAGLLDDAVESFKYVQRLDPGNGISYARVGVIRFNQRRMEDAVVSAIQAIILDPMQLEAWNTLDVTYREVYRIENAVSINGENRQLNASIPLVQDHVRSAIRELVRTQLAGKQYDFARTMAGQAIDVHRVPRSFYESMFEEAGVPLVPQPKVEKRWRDARRAPPATQSAGK